MVLETQNWKDELKQRVRYRWLGKMLATTAAIALFFYVYFWVILHPLSATTVMPVTWIDELIPFFPPSFFLYVSLWVYVGLGPALAGDARELAAWGAVSVAMAAIGLGIFLALPTKVPDFGVDLFRYPLLAFLKRVDVSGNACPSLHVAFAAFSAVVLHTQLTAMRAPRALRSGNVLWCLAIVYSTMATRQHVALDVIAGLALAAVAAIAYVHGHRGWRRVMLRT